MRVLADHPTAEGLTTDAGLCHGWAGQLAVTRAIAADAPAPDRFAESIAYLESKTTSMREALTKRGLMEGRAGAELVLAGPDTTGWTRALLIN